MSLSAIKHTLLVVLLLSADTARGAENAASPGDSLLQVLAATPDRSGKLALYYQIIGGLPQQDSAQARQLLLEAEALCAEGDDAYCRSKLSLLSAERSALAADTSTALGLYREIIRDEDTADSLRAAAWLGIAEVRKNVQELMYSIAAMEEALRVYERIGAMDKVASTQVLTGNVYAKAMKAEEAGLHYTLAANYYEKMADYHQLAQVYFYRGKLYRTLGNFSEALNYFNMSLMTNKKAPNANLLVAVYQMIAISYQDMGEQEKAMTYLDSCIQFLPQTDDPDLRINTLTITGESYYKQGDFARAITYYRQGYAATKKKDPTSSYLAHCALRLGQSYCDPDLPDSVDYYFDHALEICESNGNENYKYQLMIFIASRYITLGEVPKALQYLNEALDRAKAIGDTLNMGTIYGQLAYAEEQVNNNDMARHYHISSLKCYETVGNEGKIALLMGILASYALEEDKPDTARYYLNNARNTLLRLGDSCTLARNYVGFSRLSSYYENLDSAILYMQRARELIVQCGVKTELLTIHGDLAHLYTQKGDTARTIEALEQGLQIAQLRQKPASVKLFSEQLHDLYFEEGDTGNAYRVLLLNKSSSDSLYKEENIRALAQQEATFTYEKEKQAQALISAQREKEQEQALARQRWWTYSGIAACIVMLLVAGILYRNYQLKQRANTLLRERNREIAKQKQQLEELDHTKSRFFSNISHELRTPLTLISSPLGSILDYHKDSLPPAVREHLQLIDRNTKQLQGLIEDILDLTKLESDKIEVHPVAVSPSAFAGRLIGNYESLASHLHIHLHCEVAETLTGLCLHIDDKKVERIANNLLSNALKHTPGSGTVTLRLSHEEDKLRLSVTDTGAGIPEEDLPYIFDRYFQSRQPDAPYQGGSGIGLALARELARVMEGNLRVSSTEGEGSCFTLSVPCKVTATARAGQEAATAQKAEEAIPVEHLQPVYQPGEQKEHVLIVEDHPDMQRYVESLLLSRYHVHKASNGREALAVLGKKNIDLVISDVMMPGMDGFTLLDKLRQDPACATLPVIMLTALSEEEFRLKALNIGVDDYLPKPFSPQELLARTHNLLQNHAVRKEALREQVAAVSVQNGHAAPVDDPLEEIIKGQAWIRELVEVLRDNLETENFLFSELHETYGMSDRTFQRKVKELTGLRPKQLQHEVALQEARSLLERGAYSTLNAVASTVGIHNVTRFSQLYEARFGKHPREYFG